MKVNEQIKDTISMIFAELSYKGHYNDFHDPLVKYVKQHLPRVESGLQCDSWIWIHEGANKVAIDTFTSMHHQVKSDIEENPLVQKVISVLLKKYNVNVYSNPELEPHE